MEITLVEYTKQEQKERSDEIQSKYGYEPTEVQLYQDLKQSTELLFPGLIVKEIARAKDTKTIIFILASIN